MYSVLTAHNSQWITAECDRVREKNLHIAVLRGMPSSSAIHRIRFRPTAEVPNGVMRVFVVLILANTIIYLKASFPAHI